MTSAAELLDLLNAADAAVDRDHESARIYLKRATGLLHAQLSGAKEVQPAVSHAALRGAMPRWQAKRVVAYIEDHCGERIRGCDLVALTPLSAGHFIRTFKATFGEAPFAYIARRRIDRAQRMMLTSSAPLAAIALACGLCDQSHLTRLFRRIVGVTPNAWRREQAMRRSPSSN